MCTILLDWRSDCLELGDSGSLYTRNCLHAQVTVDQEHLDYWTFGFPPVSNRMMTKSAYLGFERTPTEEVSWSGNHQESITILANIVL